MYNSIELLNTCMFNILDKDIDSKIDHLYLSKLILYSNNINDTCLILNTLIDKYNSMNVCNICRIHIYKFRNRLSIGRDCNDRYCSNNNSVLAYDNILLKIYIAELYICILCNDNYNESLKYITNPPILSRIKDSETKEQRIMLHANIVTTVCNYPKIISILKQSNGVTHNLYLIPYIINPFYVYLNEDNDLTCSIINSIIRINDGTDYKSLNNIVTNIIINYFNNHISVLHICKIDIHNNNSVYKVNAIVTTNDITFTILKIRI